MINVLAFCGSLRARSSNASLLKAAQILFGELVAPELGRFDIYDQLADLPHFNPDVEDAGLPPSIEALRAEVGRASVVVLSTPEYARGVPGSLKNALDWLVGGPNFIKNLSC
jgi:NAD(P)H-dependent FMN reductase